jgi:hypothetical protein
LSSDELLSIVEDNIPKYKEKIYIPIQTLSMFLAQALNDDRSCSKAVNDLIIQKNHKKIRDQSVQICKRTVLLGRNCPF